MPPLPQQPHPASRARRQVPNKPCSAAELGAVGILAWQLDGDAYPADPQLAAIRRVRGYSYEVRAAALTSQPPIF